VTTPTWPSSVGGDADLIVAADGINSLLCRKYAAAFQNAARNAMEWFENVKRYIRLEPEQLAYSLLTRSQRVSHENLRLREIGSSRLRT